MTARTVASKEAARQANAPYYIRMLIANLDSSQFKLKTSAPVLKCLLFLIAHHTNIAKGFAWMSQKNLAREMGVDVRTIGRAFADAKLLNVCTVRRMRKGFRGSEQLNHYWLNIPRLRELQGSEHQTSVSDAIADEHTTLVSDANGPSTGQIEHEHRTNRTKAPDTSVREGLEVKQCKKFSKPKEPTAGDATTALALKPTHEPSIGLPQWVPIPEWHRFLQKRRELGCKNSMQELEALLSVLNMRRRDGNNPVEVLDQSFINGWKGLFPVRGNSTNPNSRLQNNLRAVGLDPHTDFSDILSGYRNRMK